MSQTFETRPDFTNPTAIPGLVPEIPKTDQEPAVDVLSRLLVGVMHGNPEALKEMSDISRSRQALAPVPPQPTEQPVAPVFSPKIVPPVVAEVAQPVVSYEPTATEAMTIEPVEAPLVPTPAIVPVMPPVEVPVVPIVEPAPVIAVAPRIVEAPLVEQPPLILVTDLLTPETDAPLVLEVASTQPESASYRHSGRLLKAGGGLAIAAALVGFGAHEVLPSGDGPSTPTAASSAHDKFVGPYVSATPSANTTPSPAASASPTAKPVQIIFHPDLGQRKVYAATLITEAQKVLQKMPATAGQRFQAQIMERELAMYVTNPASLSAATLNEVEQKTAAIDDFSLADRSCRKLHNSYDENNIAYTAQQKVVIRKIFALLDYDATRPSDLVAIEARNQACAESPVQPVMPAKRVVVHVSSATHRPAPTSTQAAPAPKPSPTKAPAPKPTATKAPAPKPSPTKSPAPKATPTKAPAPKPSPTKAPAPKPTPTKHK